MIHLQWFLSSAATGLLRPASPREHSWKCGNEHENREKRKTAAPSGTAQTMPVSYSRREMRTQGSGECAMGVFGSCGLRQCCQKPFWGGIFPAVCMSLQARIPGRDHWAVSQLSPAWQAPPSAPVLPGRRNPGTKCGKSKLAVSCVTASAAGSSVCVSESSKPAQGCFYGSTGQQEETKPLGLPLLPSFLQLGSC